MKQNNLLKYLAGLCVVLFFANCGGDSSDDEGPTLTVSPSSIILEATGSEQHAISVSSNTTWVVSKDANADWLKVGSSNGSKNGSFNIWAEDNNTGKDRSSTITVQVSRGTLSMTVTVKQGSSGTTSDSELTVNPGSLNYTYEGGAQTITVTSNVSWTVSSSQSWCTVSPASGDKNGTVTVTASANTTTSTRPAIVTIKSTTGGITREVSISQESSPVAGILKMLAGESADGKSWTWDYDGVNPVWGNMGYCGGEGSEVGLNRAGQWWGVVAENETGTDLNNGFMQNLQHTNDGKAHGDESMRAYMTLSFDGTIVRHAGNGSIINSGTFSLVPYNNNEWKVADLKTTTGTILFPYEINSGGNMPTTFEMVYLSDKKLCLVYPDGGDFESLGYWSEATFWHFKEKDFNEPDPLFETPYLNWGGSVSAVQTYMSSYTPGNNSPEARNDYYLLWYYGKYKELEVDYWFKTITGGLDLVNVFFKSSVGEDVIKAKIIEDGYSLVEYDNTKNIYYYLSSDKKTVAAFLKNSEGYWLIQYYEYSDILFETPCLDWGASVATVKNYMDNKGFVMNRDWSAADNSIIYYEPKYKEKYTYYLFEQELLKTSSVWFEKTATSVSELESIVKNTNANYWFTSDGSIYYKSSDGKSTICIGSTDDSVYIMYWENSTSARTRSYFEKQERVLKERMSKSRKVSRAKSGFKLKGPKNMLRVVQEF